MVLRLRKSLYGLKQSLYISCGTFNHFAISIGFVASRVNGALFVLHDKNQGIVVAAVSVYIDILLVIVTAGLVRLIQAHMMKRFRMHDLGSESFYLGVNTKCNQEHHMIDIHLHSFVRIILAEFRMVDSRPVATAMAMKLHKRTPDKEACDLAIYQSIIGSHMYAITATQPGIAYPIGVLGRHNHDPSNAHMVALKRAVRYLSSAKH